MMENCRQSVARRVARVARIWGLIGMAGLICASARAASSGEDEARLRALFDQWRKASHTRPSDRPPVRPTPSTPVPRSATVTSPMGMRVNPILGRRMLHSGADLSARPGMGVYATADGWVAQAGAAGGYGLLVRLRHMNGYETRYAHLSRIHVVPGTYLRKGGMIGEVGSTGRSTGPHLHYEVRRDGRPVDPMAFIAR
ncbi:M23 family metallopeptidase [Sphingobium sp. AN641]|uniref:M23 family metallopeptidase n=1 Tax=Sphingobium sp. AN641 TaxID=3133443 RepID=UPI0030C6493D